MSGFRCQKPGFCQRNLGASGLKNQNIIFYQFFNQFHMNIILFYSGICTSYNTGHSTDTSVDDVVIQRGIRATECSA
jgi:hypothetical protein